MARRLLIVGHSSDCRSAQKLRAGPSISGPCRDAWWPEILGFLQTRITNAGTEGTNRLIKDAARTAFGFRNLDNQRRRVRFNCTRRSRRSTGAEAALPPQLR